ALGGEFGRAAHARHLRRGVGAAAVHEGLVVERAHPADPSHLVFPANRPLLGVAPEALTIGAATGTTRARFRRAALIASRAWRARSAADPTRRRACAARRRTCATGNFEPARPAAGR